MSASGHALPEDPERSAWSRHRLAGLPVGKWTKWVTPTHRVREESKKPGTRRGIQSGLTAPGGVITSAGMVLAGTFTVMATLPLTFMAEIGFVVAFVVLLDTLIVRSLLLQAMSHKLGRRIWAPSKLARTTDGDGPAGPDGTGEDPRVLSPTG